MVHGYHVIVPMYGFWLPNDPRGTWSDFVRKWEIAKFGKPCRNIERKELGELTAEELRNREAARAALLYPPVKLNTEQLLTIAAGLQRQIATSSYILWACSILPEHTHLVLARHTYKVERMVNLLKGATTTEMIHVGNHPMKDYCLPDERPPRMWSAHQWKVFLDSEDAIRNAIAYVEENPEKEGLPRQFWPFVAPFSGINTSAKIFYH